jgi:hypothetical protein
VRAKVGFRAWNDDEIAKNQTGAGFVAVEMEEMDACAATVPEGGNGHQPGGVL